MKRVFLYVRVSTEEQAIHGLSIKDQTSALEEWAKREGHLVVGIYTDAGISARKPASKRPDLQRLLKDIQEGKGDLVLFTRLDRWFRNIAEYYKVQEILEKNNVDWKTIREDYDTSTASGRLKINIMLSVAQDEADRTSERIKAINEMKRQKREPLTGDCPTGYKLDGKKLIKDPDKEHAVSGFFETYINTGSVALAMEFALRNNLRIYYQLAHKMLSSPCYYGHYYDVDNMTPPYITKEQFEKIQSMRKRVVRKTKHNRVYLFSGLVYCGECGGRMGGRVNTNQASQFYNCTSHYMRISGCKNTSNMLERKIEDFLLESIEKKMEQLQLDIEDICDTEKRRDYASEIAAQKAKSSRLKELYVNGLISMEECKTGIQEYEKKIKELQEMEKKLKIPDFSEIEKILNSEWKSMYFSLTREQKRESWRKLVKKIAIFQDRHIEFDLNI